MLFVCLFVCVFVSVSLFVRLCQLKCFQLRINIVNRTNWQEACKKASRSTGHFCDISRRMNQNVRHKHGIPDVY